MDILFSLRISHTKGVMQNRTSFATTFRQKELVWPIIIITVLLWELGIPFKKCHKAALFHVNNFVFV